jgi:polar amino acid transport system substrate-binding protein
MRPHLCLTAAALAVASLVGTAQTTQLRLVSTPWPPFTNASGQPRFALDLVEAGLTRAGISATTTLVEPRQFTASLLSGDFDGSAAAWRDAERERALYFSQSYLENRLILIGRKGADVSATTLGDLRGKKIAIVEGYAYGDIHQSGPTFVRSRSEEDSLSRLLAASVDYALMDELAVQYIADHHAKEAHSRLQLGGTPLIRRQLHLVVRRSLPDGESIIMRFNAQLRGMIADRTYHRLLHVSWIQADVDGDGKPENVPKSDQAGTKPPERTYSIYAPTPPDSFRPTVPDMNKPGFYVGGTIYPDWASVPANYKVPEPNKPPDARGSTASVFKFVW